MRARKTALSTVCIPVHMPSEHRLAGCGREALVALVRAVKYGRHWLDEAEMR